jgi:hypothetical protein
MATVIMSQATFLLACNQYGSEVTKRLVSPFIILKFFDTYFESATPMQRRGALIQKSISYDDLQAYLIKEKLLEISN